MFDAAPEPKESLFVPQARHEDLIRYAAGSTPSLNARFAHNPASQSGNYSYHVGNDIDDKTDDYGCVERREERVKESNVANPDRRHCDVGCRVAHCDRKRVIHEIPKIGHLAFGKLEPLMID